MAEKNKERRRQARGPNADSECQRDDLPESQVKEYHYMLLVLPEELAVLEKYREALVNGTSGFAETYYNYLFDNPDIADALYSFERSGGDTGSLIRTELANMLGSVVNQPDPAREAGLLKAG